MEELSTVKIIPEYFLATITADETNICYSLKLSGLTKRRTADIGSQSKLSGLMSGLSNAISDTISSATQEAYLLRTVSGKMWLLSDKMSPVSFDIDAISKNIDIESEIKISMIFPSSEIENATFKLSKDSISNTFSGSIKQMIADFGNVLLENMPDFFVTAVMSRHTSDNELYKFKPYKNIATLISYDNNGITLLNEHKRIGFDSVLAYHLSEGYCELVIREKDEFILVELFEDAMDKIPETELNLIRNDIGGSNTLAIPFPSETIRAENFLAVFEANTLSVIAADNKIYSFANGSLLECGIFKVNEDIYVKTADGITQKYADCEKITKTLSLLPYGYDSIFTNIEEPQPFIFKGELVNFAVNNSEIKSGDYMFEYSKMQNCCYKANDFGCIISFLYDGQQIGMTTANSLGVYVCNLQEKVFITAVTKTYNINQLYDCFYKRCNKNFLASTFSEIFKTDKLLNIDSTVDELITALRADESDVLRNAFQSMLGKFKNVEDIQSNLLQKVTLLEIQRRKIQKIFDEWLLYYPHYMASIQVKWLKYVFSSAVNNEMLNTEYWKCVAHYKRILSSGNAYVQKNMNEIGSCINRISSALPDDVKRTDITSDLRVNSNTTKNVLNAGVDVMVGVTAGVELANLLIRGLTVSNPFTLSLSAKMLVDSYTKDVTMRKNVKAFGLQSLEWWKIFMNGLRIQIIELTNGVNEYNKICLRRDTELFKKLSEQSKEHVKNKLSDALKDKIIESIDNKFMEILPQFNMRISNIIDEIDSNTDFLNVSLNEFKNNLFI